MNINVKKDMEDVQEDLKNFKERKRQLEEALEQINKRISQLEGIQTYLQNKLRQQQQENQKAVQEAKVKPPKDDLDL